MLLFTDESLKHIRKKWNRLTSSKWTKLFATLFVVQFCLVVFFHSRMLERNNLLYHDGEFQESYKCDKASAGRNPETSNYLFTFSTIQSVIFMLFQLYFVYFGFNAIFHEHIIQIITLVVMDFVSSGCALAQLFEIKIRIDRVVHNTECPRFGFNVDLLGRDVPPIIITFVFSILSAIIARKLYQQFGWNIYKRIGGDVEIHKIYRNNLLFKVFLKLNIFFWIIYIMPTIFWIIYMTLFQISLGEAITIGAVEKVLLVYHAIATVLALILQILAYRSVNQESRKGMITFSILWLLIIADYGLLIYASVRLLVFGSYFLVLFTSVYLVISLITLVYSIIVTANFGRGLQEAIQRYKDRTKKQTTYHVPQTLNVPPVSSPKPSSSVYSQSSAATSQHISNHGDEKKNDLEQQIEDSRWTIDD